MQSFWNHAARRPSWTTRTGRIRATTAATIQQASARCTSKSAVRIFVRFDWTLINSKSPDRAPTPALTRPPNASLTSSPSAVHPTTFRASAAPTTASTSTWTWIPTPIPSHSTCCSLAPQLRVTGTFRSVRFLVEPHTRVQHCFKKVMKNNLNN